MKPLKYKGKLYLSRNSGTNDEEEVAEIPINSRRQYSKWIIRATFGNLSQERKEEHV